MHGRRIKRRLMRPTVHPSVDSVGPFLEHVTALQFILGLVVDASGGFSLLVGQAFLDPVAIETEFVEQVEPVLRRSCTVNGSSGRPCSLALTTTAVVMRLNVARDIGASAS